MRSVPRSPVSCAWPPPRPLKVGLEVGSGGRRETAGWRDRQPAGFQSIWRAGYRIRPATFSLGRLEGTKSQPQLTSRSSYLAVLWRPKALRVVAVKVGFEVGPSELRRPSVIISEGPIQQQLAPSLAWVASPSGVREPVRKPLVFAERTIRRCTLSLMMRTRPDVGAARRQHLERLAASGAPRATARRCLAGGGRGCSRPGTTCLGPLSRPPAHR